MADKISYKNGRQKFVRVPDFVKYIHGTCQFWNESFALF
jgi:hypothetical protein